MIIQTIPDRTRSMVAHYSRKNCWNSYELRRRRPNKMNSSRFERIWAYFQRKIRRFHRQQTFYRLHWTISRQLQRCYQFDLSAETDRQTQAAPSNDEIQWISWCSDFISVVAANASWYMLCNINFGLITDQLFLTDAARGHNAIIGYVRDTRHRQPHFPKLDGTSLHLLVYRCLTP